MSVPDPTPDVVTAAWRELKAEKASPLAAAGVGTDPYLWLFAWRPEISVKGTAKCSVVLSSVRAWGAPNRHNTARFPQLQVEVYADIDRESDLAPDHRTAQRKADDVWKVIDPVFHRVSSRNIEWGNSDGSLHIVSSLRSADPRIEDVPETDGVVRLTSSYDIVPWG